MLFTVAASNPVGHVTDKPIYGQWYVSNVTLMLLLSGVLTAWLIIPAAKKIATGRTEGHAAGGRSLDDFRTQGVLANLVETVCVYLRDQVFRPLLGEQTDRFTPMLWTFFWFILINNLLGLVPFVDITALFFLNAEIQDGQATGHYYGFGGTATQSIWVTGTLAAISATWFNGIALMKDPKGYFLHMTGGAPVFMWPIMLIVEFIGTLVKPFALALRLFANMTGGHIIVATLLGFFVQLSQWKAGVGHAMALIPLLGTIAVYMLELLVAFIQAYIFTFLSCLFLSQLVVHHGHDEHHAHEEGHGHEAGHAHAAAGH
jgi:F-type H+-transporting ATPase subunit a